MAMGYRSEKTSQLQGLHAMSMLAQTLLGPNRYGRQTGHIDIILTSISSENATLALLAKAVENHKQLYGTGCTLLVNLVQRLAECILDLKAQNANMTGLTVGLNKALTIALNTCQRMQINVNEWLEEMGTCDEMVILGRALISSCSEQQSAMITAVEVAKALTTFYNLTYHIPGFVRMHSFVGPKKTWIERNLLIEIDTSTKSYDHFCHPKQSSMIALIDGSASFSTELIQALRHLEVGCLISSQEINSQLHDWCQEIDIICFATPQLHLIASIFQLPIFSTIKALAKTTVLRSLNEPVVFQLYTSSTIHHKDDEKISFLRLTHGSIKHCSVVVQRPSLSLAQETVRSIEICLARLHQAWHSRVVLPGGGAVFSACAVAIRHELPTDIFAGIFADALELVNLQLLLNQGSYDYLSAKCHLNNIMKNFENGMNTSDQYLETVFYGQTLTPLWTVSEQGLQKGRRFDCYKSTKDILRTSVRLVTMMAMINRSIINCNTANMTN
ncbi:hypothetical protein THRCLA_21651 [Thraustotheca clavata]|uniref:Uncharacterized protein n=1 Tax=Thraustotheca clavata TaxID=74557 RepID=A0A1V9ZT51_9STRA|nr:hypothetical protein THRCLA_21651 [Thraustotheca clavata]